LRGASIDNPQGGGFEAADAGVDAAPEETGPDWHVG